MTVLGSPVLWVILVSLLVVAFLLIGWHERAKRRRPTQRLGAEPYGQPMLIVVDIGPDAAFNKVTHAYHVATAPQSYAKTFVPSKE